MRPGSEPDTSGDVRPSTSAGGSSPSLSEGSTAHLRLRLVLSGLRSYSRWRISRPKSLARLAGPCPFPSSSGAAGLSLFGLVLVRAARGVVCGWKRPSASDAGAAREARAHSPSSAIPLSLHFVGQVAESPASPSHALRGPHRVPQARGGPRSPREPRQLKRDTNGRDPSQVGEGRSLERTGWGGRGGDAPWPTGVGGGLLGASGVSGPTTLPGKRA